MPHLHVQIPEPLLRAVRVRAAERGITIRQATHEAIRLYVDQPKPKPANDTTPEPEEPTA
jgi:hypothetical protein